MKNIARILLALAAAAIFVSPLVAEERGQQRYIVVIRRQRFGPPPTPDVVRLGGTIESRQDDQLVVTIPAGALAALKGDPAVLYVERVGGTSAGDDSPLIGEPADPQPTGAQSKRFVPHALGTISWDSGNYGYDGAGNIVSIGTDNYLYDGVQRLRQSSTQGSAETYTYDGFGNMKTKTNTTIPGVQASTNRYDGYTYNEVGAVKTDGSYEFTYDALGQPLSKKYNNDNATQEYYIYTANDERIGVERNDWWTWSVRDEGGKVLRQYKSSATNTSAPALWVEDFVWRDGLLLGSQRPVEMGGRRHFHLDHLGTPRLITSDSGQMVSYHDYYPFGDEHSPVQQEHPSGFDREDPMKFTGHERDYAGGMGAEDGHAVDYMHARYYNGGAERFLSVDPVLHADRALHAPQMWNRYTYALDNPLVYTDPTGATVYVVTYTVGNDYGDDEFKQAAMTEAAAIKGSKGYDPKRDTVVLSGVRNKADFAKTLATAKSLESTYGKVGQLSLFSHAGPTDGPTFHHGVAPLEQFSKADLKSMSVNWDWWGNAKFFGCNTGLNFTQSFADAQGVTAYGFTNFASFSSSPNSWSIPWGSGPLYMVQTKSNYTRGGFWGAAAKWFGFARDVVPMTPADPHQ